MLATTRESAPPASQGWRELCKAAMAETDLKVLAFRINEAEGAIGRRDRELFAMRDDNAAEREAIDHAFHKLQVLSYCLKLKTSHEDGSLKRTGHRLTNLRSCTKHGPRLTIIWNGGNHICLWEESPLF